MSLFQSRQKDGTISIQATGYVTKDPYIPESGKIVFFTVCYGKQKYLDCKAWANTAAGRLAACLEKHDTVCVTGDLDEYEAKDGTRKQQLVVDFLTVQMEPPQSEYTNE